MTRTFCIASLVLLASCATGPQLITDQLVGRWEMVQIIQDGANDVSDEHNPAGNRYVIFNADQTFESGGDPNGKNTGQWQLNEKTGELFVNSDAGEADDSYWIVSIDGDTMKWQGARFEFNKRFEINHVRAGN